MNLTLQISNSTVLIVITLNFIHKSSNFFLLCLNFNYPQIIKIGTCHCTGLNLWIGPIDLSWFSRKANQPLLISWSVEYPECLALTLPTRTLTEAFAAGKLFTLWWLWAFKFRFYSSWFYHLFQWCLFHIYRFSFLRLRFFCPFSCVHCVTWPNRLPWYRFLLLVV